MISSVAARSSGLSAIHEVRMLRETRCDRKVVTKHIPPVENSHIQNTDL